MERANILPFLYEYTDLELELKKTFLCTGAPVSMSEFTCLLKKHDMLLNNQALEGTELSHSHFFANGQSILALKHPRYAPPTPHAHDFIEISYVLSGSCRESFIFSSNPSHVDERILTAGQVCIIPPGLTHTISILDDSIVLNILIHTDTMKKKLPGIIAGEHALYDFFLYTLYENEHPNYLLFSTGTDETIKNVILDIFTEGYNNHPYSQNIMLLMIGLVFTCLQRHYTDDLIFSDSGHAALTLIPSIFHYINTNYATATVSGIAKHFNVSTSWLEHAFRENTNTRLSEQIIRTRLKKACELLETTKLSVSDITESIGYTDTTYFIRLFKKNMGVTPLQYRKSLQ